jgi:hypothetical protein
MNIAGAVVVAQEIVQQVANLQGGLPDEEDTLEVHADELEEIVLRVLKDFGHVEPLSPGVKR